MNTLKSKRKINKIMAIVLFITVFVMSTAIVASATNEAEDALTKLAEYVFDIGRVIGVLIAFFGILQIGQSISQHDPSQRTTGFFIVAGGVIIFFGKDLLALIGVSL